MILQEMSLLAQDPQRVWAFDIPLKRKDGGTVEVSASVSGVFDVRHRFLGCCAIYRDISDRQQIIREQALLAGIVKASDDAIISYSKAGIITSWNPAAENLYGYSASEVVGTKYDPYLVSNQIDKVRELVRDVTEGGQSFVFEQQAKRKDESNFFASINVFPTYVVPGVILGGAAVIRDITQR
jgi:PAS domain S-box-containing protein